MQTFDRYKTNLKFDGASVYSYGKRVAKVDGPHLVQLGWWSMTMQKHVNYAAQQLGLELTTGEREPQPKRKKVR